MTLPSLAGAPWLTAPAVGRIFAVLNQGGDEGRVVGGAVRNALMGLPVTDIDFATTAAPETVAARAEAAGVKPVPTGLAHGTLTLVADGIPFEVTTLREDVETDGRRAVVRHQRDWQTDARRRDFTVNALFADADGRIHDPVGGYADVLARRIRFIGDAGRRIAEDRLRLLRFFRLHAAYGEGPADAEGLGAAIRARDGLRALSAERVGQEMRKLVLARRAGETAALMQDSGVLPVVLAGVADLAAFARLPAAEAAAGAAPAAATALGVLACRVPEDALRIAERLRLANAERDRMLAALAAEPLVAPGMSARQARAALYRAGPEAWRDGVVRAACRHGPGAWTGALAGLAGSWPVPRFPLSGRDLVAMGFRHGPAVGAALRELEAWWVAADFIPSREELSARAQQRIAAEQ